MGGAEHDEAAPPLAVRLFTSRNSIWRAALLPAALTTCGKSITIGPSGPTSTPAPPWAQGTMASISWRCASSASASISQASIPARS